MLEPLRFGGLTNEANRTVADERMTNMLPELPCWFGAVG